jgi:hypothetical protein
MIKAGDCVKVPGGLPGYADRAAAVLKTDGDNALIDWTEADGSHTATWEPFARLVPADPEPAPVAGGEE